MNEFCMNSVFQGKNLFFSLTSTSPFFSAPFFIAIFLILLSICYRRFFLYMRVLACTAAFFLLRFDVTILLIISLSCCCSLVSSFALFVHFSVCALQFQRCYSLSPRLFLLLCILQFGGSSFLLLRFVVEYMRKCLCWLCDK